MLSASGQQELLPINLQEARARVRPVSTEGAVSMNAKPLAQATINAGHTAVATENDSPARRKAEKHVEATWNDLVRYCARRFGPASAKRIALQEVAFA